MKDLHAGQLREMKPRVGDLIVMRDESLFEGMMGIVILEEDDHYYGRVKLEDGKTRMFDSADVNLGVQSDDNSYYYSKRRS